MKNEGQSKIVVLIIAIAVFVVLVVGTSFAYFATNTSVTNVTNINVVIPSVNTMITTNSTTCVINLSQGSMSMFNQNLNSAAASSNCELQVILSGDVGVKCSYDVVLKEIDTSVNENYVTYVPTTGLGNDYEYEFTGSLSVPNNGVNIAKVNSVDTNTVADGEVQMDVLAGPLNVGVCKDSSGNNLFIGSETECTNNNGTNVWTNYSEDGLLAKGVIEVTTQGTTAVHTYGFLEKWYNLTISQEGHSGRTYSFVLSAENIVC